LKITSNALTSKDLSLRPKVTYRAINQSINHFISGSAADKHSQGARCHQSTELTTCACGLDKLKHFASV